MAMLTRIAQEIVCTPPVIDKVNKSQSKIKRNLVRYAYRICGCHHDSIKYATMMLMFLYVYHGQKIIKRRMSEMRSNLGM